MEVHMMVVLDQRVRLLNEKAFRRVQHEAYSLELPVDDPDAVWSALCDRAFQNLEGAVADEEDEKNILPHVPSVLDRSEFETAVQEGYRCFARLNRLEKRVKDTDMELKEADDCKQQASAREAEQRDAWEQQMSAQAAEHRKQLAQLEETLAVYHRLFRVTDKTDKCSLKEQKLPVRRALCDMNTQPALTPTGTSPALPPTPSATTTTTTETQTRQSPKLPPTMVTMWKAAMKMTAIMWKVAMSTMVTIWMATSILFSVGVRVWTWMVFDPLQDEYDRIQEEEQPPVALMLTKYTSSFSLGTAFNGEGRGPSYYDPCDGFDDPCRGSFDLSDGSDNPCRGSFDVSDGSYDTFNGGGRARASRNRQCETSARKLPHNQRVLSIQATRRRRVCAPDPSVGIASYGGGRDPSSYNPFNGGEQARNVWNRWQQANAGRSFDSKAERSEAYQREKHLYI